MSEDTKIYSQISQLIKRNLREIATGKVSLEELLENELNLSKLELNKDSAGFSCSKDDIFNYIAKVRGYIDDNFIEEIVKAVNNPNIAPNEAMRFLVDGFIDHILKMEEKLGLITNFTEDIFTRFSTLQKLMTTSMGKNLRFAQDDLKSDDSLLVDAQNIHRLILDADEPVALPSFEDSFKDFLNIFDVKVKNKKEHVSEMNNDIGSIYTELESYKKEVESLKTRMVKYQLESITDHLTGLHNRKYLELKLDEEIERFKRLKIPFSVLMLDIDDFKYINDTYGHLVGDQVLKHIAHIANKSIRKTDLVFRYGGEEFVILFINADVRNATQIAETIRKNIESTSFTLKKKNFNITASFGVTQYKDAELPNALLDRADDLMYEAKQNGKNLVVSDTKKPKKQ